MKYDVIVIGGGASGMTAAVCAARKKKRVLLLEKSAKLGRKIAASGNGKCNLTNELISTACYYDAYPDELSRILERCTKDAILDFMKSIGVVCKEKRGYYYPVSEQAAVVVQMLQAELVHNKVTIKTEESCTNCYKEETLFHVVTDKAEYQAQSLIMASGGMAAPKLGADDSGYRILKNMGHCIKKLSPALVQLTTKERYVKNMSGVRTEAAIRLICNKQGYCEKGEIIFTDAGVSGIPVFQISRYVQVALQDGQAVSLYIDTIPLYSKEELKESILALIRYNPSLTLEYLFRTYCNHKLVYAVLKEYGFEAELPCKNLKQQELERIIHVFKNLSFQISGTNGFESAQVTRGGVPLDEVWVDTMESKLVKGLYITGELLDIDGMCGGYNLHFAWSSGMLAGNAVKQNEAGQKGKEDVSY